MKKFFLTVTLCFAAIGAWAADGLSLKDIVSGAYSPQYVYGVNPMNDGETYTQLEDGGRKMGIRALLQARCLLLAASWTQPGDMVSVLRAQGTVRRLARDGSNEICVPGMWSKM